MLRFLTAGESHGPGLVAVVEGLPSGIEATAEGLAAQLARRRLGHGRGRRMRVERDEFEILGGVRFGRTTGGPVAVVVRNSEWPAWQAEMSAAPGSSESPVGSPRPGHADLAGMLKYDTHDARDILERASARETAARAVVGWLSGTLLAEIGVEVLSHVVAIGGVAATPDPAPGPGDRSAVDASPVRTFDREAEAEMMAVIDAARAGGDTVGGVVEVAAHSVPAGLGSHVHWDRRIDARIAAALMSIPSVKGVEIGSGFGVASERGSGAHDGIEHGEGGFIRTSNRAGGVEGGITNGSVVVARAHMKPLSTLMRPLASVDVVTKAPGPAARERSDVCSVPAAGVIGEHMLSFVLADEALRKFGGDTVSDFTGSVAAYRRRLEVF